MNSKQIGRGVNIVVISVVFSLALASLGHARDSASKQSIVDAMETATAKSYSDVAFYFGDQPHSAVKKSIGTYTAKRSTNAFGKSDYDSCQWAFLSAIKSLYERALRERGNAVVNIRSITTGQETTSRTEFDCRAGNIVSKVYLKGDVVEL